MLGEFNGPLATDDVSGHHALHRPGITAAFCRAHARRTLFWAFEPHASETAGQAVARIAKRYQIERKVKDLGDEDRLPARQRRSRPVAHALHTGLAPQRLVLARADATARALDYPLSNGSALTRFLDDGPCRSTTTPLRTPSDRAQSGERTGFLSSRWGPASAPLS